MHRLSVDERVRRTLYHLGVGVEAFNDLHGGSIILPQGHVDKLSLISIGALYHRGYLQSLGAKDERGYGNDQGHGRTLHIHVNLAVRPGHELAVMVLDIKLYQQGS
jgi:hypothetical protein